MTRRMDRHRVANKYRSGLDSLSGDAATTQLATGGIAELLKSVGNVAAEAQAKKEADAKAADAKKARQAANDAAANANTAKMKAAGEKDPNGPLHIDAQKLADKAAQLDSAARVLEGLPASSGPSPDSGKGGGGKQQSAPSVFTATNVLIGVGVLVAGVVGVKLLRGKSKGRR